MATEINIFLNYLFIYSGKNLGGNEDLWYFLLKQDTKKKSEKAILIAYFLLIWFSPVKMAVTSDGLQLEILWYHQY